MKIQDLFFFYFLTPHPTTRTCGILLNKSHVWIDDTCLLNWSYCFGFGFFKSGIIKITLFLCDSILNSNSVCLARSYLSIFFSLFLSVDYLLILLFFSKFFSRKKFLLPLIGHTHTTNQPTNTHKLTIIFNFK